MGMTALLRQAGQATLGSVDQRGDVALGQMPVPNQLVDVAGLGVVVRVPEGGLHLALANQVVERRGLLVVEQVRALIALLHVPEVADVHHRVVAAGPGADHDHAATLADEYTGRDRVLARVVEDDVRALLLAEHVPDRLAEALGALEPGLPLRRVPRRRDPPARERLAVDVPHGAEALRVLALLLA